MASHIGEAITPRDVEFITGSWPGEDFTALCDALTWAASGGRWGPMPSFSGRINVKDAGVDAEGVIPLESATDSFIPTPILGTGWNVLQYKQRDIAARDRARSV